MAKITYHREGSIRRPVYYGYDSDRQYAIIKLDGRGSGWSLRIRCTVETAGIQHAIGEPNLHVVHVDTLAEGREIAQRYSDLTSDYARQNGVSRISRAVRDYNDAADAKLYAECRELGIEI